MYRGRCNCERVKYTLPYKPDEIAYCHCTICQSTHCMPFVRFAKYDIDDVLFTGTKHIEKIPSSKKAARSYCKVCDTLLFMHYKNSDNIWINADTFLFNSNDVEHYDIYTDTSLIDLSYNTFWVTYNKIASILAKDHDELLVLDINPKLQQFASQGNVILTVIDEDNTNVYMAHVYYDEETNDISEPI